VAAAAALVTVVGASAVMEVAATALGRRYAVAGIVTGALVLAVVTSLPNAVTAVCLARKGRGAAVLSTALNSNAINVTAGLLVPASLTGLGPPAGQDMLVAGWYAGLTLLALAYAYRGRGRGRAYDPSLTAAGGMLAVTELCERLGLIAALDEGMGPVKQRRRGFTGGQLAGMAAAQLAGQDFLVGLDRVRADQAGQLVTPVPGLATSTATGIARRFTGKHWRGAEAGLAAATARMVSLLPAERTAELAEGPVTIDIDATDVEVYGSKKRGVAYNYQGQRVGRPHVASWAETEIPLAASLLAGDQDPRSHVTGLLGGRWPRCRRPSATGRPRRAARSRCAPMPGTSPGTWPGPPPRRTWRSRSAPSGSPACGRRWAGSERMPGGTRPAWKARRSRSRRISRRTGRMPRCC
jgi:Sodium/calcium exchanger protein